MTFSGLFEMPPHAEAVTATAWSFGDRAFSRRPRPVADPKPHVVETATRTYAKPGTHFARAWATSQRDGRTGGADTAIHVPARVRVVVR